MVRSAAAMSRSKMHVRDNAKGLFGRGWCELAAHPAGFFYGIDEDAVRHLADDGFDVGRR